MKNYTSIEQAKKLAEFLPLESADGFYAENVIITEPFITYLNGERNIPAYKGAIPCWSLAPLLNVLPDSIYDNTQEFSQLEFTKKSVAYIHGTTDSIKIGVIKDNLVDACVEMILKLHEQKLL